MKKCYIAGKIGGLSEMEYKGNFESAKDYLKNIGVEPVSPLDLPHNHDRTWNSYMREDLAAMLQCDAVYAINNWRLSPGAKIEVELALNVGMPILQQGQSADVAKKLIGVN